MPSNPWLAIDAATPPRLRARELRVAWEHFLSNGRLDDVRGPIADSWRRSSAAGVDPSGHQLAPVLADADATSARWDVHPLRAAAPLIRECLAPIADEAAHLIVVSDAGGMLLWISGNARVRLDAADSMNFTEGALWSERGAGTNAIGTALAADHAVQVFAAEHFNEVVQRWTCSAAPVHDPDSGELLGVIDITGLMRTQHPHSLALALTTAHAVESDLRVAMHERDARLWARYHDRVAGAEGRCALVTPTGRVLSASPEGWLVGDRLELPAGGGELTLASGAHAFAEPVGHDDAFVVRAAEVGLAARRRRLLRVSLLGRDRALVEIDGRPIAVGRRHAEILALLCGRPEGMTSEELAADLYGDDGHPSSVRVELHRLRKVLGDCIDTEPYRLSIDLESDVARVRGLLDRGSVREAAERYVGALLPRSDAPGVLRAREELETWLRQAVMTSDDDDALWAWLQSSSGRDDLPAWKRMLTRLDFRDPRRSLAAAQVRSLRASFAT
jgi:GAF domain